MTVLSPMQSALYSALSGQVTVNSAVVPVYDYVPADTATPYIVIGDATETPDGIGEQYAITERIHIYTVAMDGYTSSLAIEAQAESLVKNLIVTGYSVAAIQFTRQTQGQGLNRHVILTVVYNVGK